ncbi:uncharacterized protein BDV17DRAFT_81381 [Aspergillus undulatus]|uniref:uncharacterized protein n=1 Tax=Aspergillus undulatus TaxID=1810928 RepID=UPI003CCC9E8E
MGFWEERGGNTSGGWTPQRLERHGAGSHYLNFNYRYLLTYSESGVDGARCPSFVASWNGQTLQALNQSCKSRFNVCRLCARSAKATLITTSNERQPNCSMVSSYACRMHGSRKHKLTVVARSIAKCIQFQGYAQIPVRNECPRGGSDQVALGPGQRLTRQSTFQAAIDQHAR